MKEDLQKVHYLEHVLPDPGRRMFVLLTGARQTGKTTLARLKHPGLRFINLDVPENREAVRTISSASWTK